MADDAKKGADSPSSKTGDNSSASSPVAGCPLECPTKVVFTPHGKKWGWDDLTDANVPWMSVENGKSDTVKANADPAGEGDRMCNVTYESSNADIEVTPASGTANNQTLTIKAKAVGEATITAKCGGSTRGKFKVASYDLVTKKVALRLVHETNYTSTDVTLATVQAFCDKVYKQAVVKFDITRKADKTIAFDLDANGMINVSGAWPGPELQKIVDAAADPASDFNVYMVDNPDDDSLGWSGFNNAEKSCVAHVKSTGRGDAVAIEMTIAHESGHGLFGLKHPWDETGESAVLQGDTVNIMNQGDSTTLYKLRYYQWKRLH